MFNLTGKTALITGASGGIGAAIATQLHAAGATIAISGTRQAVLEELKSQIGENVHVLPCNLSNPEDVEKTHPRRRSCHGRLGYSGQ
jgi:3-oxoacyl-[acyl-carrier protein] reductase